jgi:hypothetical protein
MLTLTQARQFAGHFHGGQGSALYSFCSTGGFHFPLSAYLDELDALPEKADASLLADYLRHAHPLPDGGGLWLDVLTIRNTAFDSFADLVFARGGYYPSFSRMQTAPDERDRWEYEVLADAYDLAQERRGDPRRAWRGCALEE